MVTQTDRASGRRRVKAPVRFGSYVSTEDLETVMENSDYQTNETIVDSNEGQTATTAKNTRGSGADRSNKRPATASRKAVSFKAPKATKELSQTTSRARTTRARRMQEAGQNDEGVQIETLRPKRSRTSKVFIPEGTIPESVEEIRAIVIKQDVIGQQYPTDEGQRKSQHARIEADSSHVGSEDTGSKRKRDWLRSPPSGQPLIWAEGRQALCETLSEYRAFQGAAYCTEGYAHGFMFAKDTTARSFLDEEIVITRAAGCQGAAAGEMVQVKDQSWDDAQVKDFVNTKRSHYPVLGILGKDNLQCAIEPPHAYNVMEYFQVTDIWSEKNNGFLCIRYRLEKIDLESRSWWVPVNSPDPPSNDTRGWSVKTPTQMCLDCGNMSKHIFTAGWICLESRCRSFWKLNGQEPPKNLAYTSAFLNERTKWIYPVPRLPRQTSEELAQENVGRSGYSRDAWKGIVCPKCGRCTSREHWTHWHCDTKDCDFMMEAHQPIIHHLDVAPPHERKSGPPAPRDLFEGSVRLMNDAFQGNWRVMEYELCPGNTVHHFYANKWINKEPQGPDDMFRQFQEGNGCGLLRGEMTQHIGTGKAVATHFAKNFGLPYKYIVKVKSESFASAPIPVLNALSRMTWAGKKSTHVNNTEFLDFNELLAVGYFTESRMGFHDDGEKELGPVVATLSLGCPAKMTMRMKARYYGGKTKTGIYNPNEPVLPGCYLEEERKALNARRDDMTREEFDQAINAMYEGAKRGGKKRNTSSPPNILTMELRHGDIVVMNGYEMQKYYEHAVTPNGSIRFALTCRFIKPELVDASEHRKADYDHSLVTFYNGFETQGPSAGLDPGRMVEETSATSESKNASPLTELMSTPSSMDESVEKQTQTGHGAEFLGTIESESAGMEKPQMESDAVRMGSPTTPNTTQEMDIRQTNSAESLHGEPSETVDGVVARHENGGALDVTTLHVNDTTITEK